MITLGLVANVDDDGIYVTMPGSRGVLRGPFQTLQDVTAGDKVLMVTTDDGESVIVGQAAAAATGVVTSAMIEDGTIVNADINASAAIARSKISGLPTSSTDNTVPRFDGTGGALQGSGVTIADSNGVTVPGGYVQLSPASGSPALILSASASATYSEVDFTTAGSSRWRIRKNATAESGSNAGSDLEIQRRNDSGSTLSTLTINRATGKITLPDVGSTAGLEFGSSGPRMMVGTGGPSGISAPVGSTWRQTDANTSHGSLTGLLWNKVNTGTAEGTDWLVDYEGRWVSYTPTITASSGSFTTVSGSGVYTQRGKMATVKIKVTITTNGTAAGVVVATLPTGCNSASSEWQGAGRADTSGKMLQVKGYSSTQVQIADYVSAYPGSSGESLRTFITYEIA